MGRAARQRGPVRRYATILASTAVLAVVVGAGTFLLLHRKSPPDQPAAAGAVREVDQPPYARLGAPQDPIVSGPAFAVDGDTLAMGPVRVRLFGIDAPEAGQTCRMAGRPYPCGQRSAAETASLIANRVVTCHPMDLDRFRRVVAKCFRDDGMDIGSELVARGWALAFRQFSSEYVAVEDTARFQQRGMWAGEFEAPWAFRSSR